MFMPKRSISPILNNTKTTKEKKKTPLVSGMETDIPQVKPAQTTDVTMLIALHKQLSAHKRNLTTTAPKQESRIDPTPKIG